VYVVTSFLPNPPGTDGAARLNGFIANADIQVTSAPVKVIAVVS
jgi:hypothetical protein